MVINDLNSCFSSFRGFTPAFCVFDEFGSYASSNLAETISLQRSQGMHAIIGTQSIATVKLKSSDTRRIAEELIACCNTFIIHRINHVEDAELFAKIIGTRDTVQYTSTVYDKPLPKGSILGNTPDDIPRAIGSTRTVEKFKINPQQIKDLKQGEAIVLRKAANAEAVQIKIRDIFAPAVEAEVIPPARNWLLYANLVLGGVVALVVGGFIVWWNMGVPPHAKLAANTSAPAKAHRHHPPAKQQNNVTPANIASTSVEPWVYIYNTTTVDQKCCRVDYRLQNQGPVQHLMVKQMPRQYKMSLAELEALQ